MLTSRERKLRIEAADFWDRYVAAWLEGDDSLPPPLDRWFAAYRGRNSRTQVDLSCYPDPYVGDLRGDRAEPKIVMLGINPGRGYAPLQGRGGVWAERIRQDTLSRCFYRSPEEDVDGWLFHHKDRSDFWRERLKFAADWVGHTAEIQDILMMELYPWHSVGVSSAVRPPEDLLQRFFWGPISEIRVSHVFGFSRDWREMGFRLGLPLIYDEIVERKANGAINWRLVIFRLNASQVLVTSTYSNSTPPYGDRFPVLLEHLRSAGVPHFGGR